MSEADYDDMRELSTPEALELAEIDLIRIDLGFSIRAIEQWARFAALLDEGDQMIGASLFRDGIVQFFSCFDAKQKTHRLSVVEVYNDADGSSGYFKRLKDIRDSYAAHRFGPMRQSVVGALVMPSGVRAVSVLSAIKVYADVSEAPRLINFMRMAETHAANKVAHLRVRVEEMVGEMSAEEIRRLPPASIKTAIAPKDIRTTREAFLAARRKNARSSSAG